MPELISRNIEKKIFKIENFKLHNNKISVKKPNDTNFLIKLIDNRIALINESIISIYHHKNYTLDEEININDNNDEKMKITCLFQMKNQNLVCGTNSGHIIIYKKDFDSDEYEKIQHKSGNAIILKIDKFYEGLICVLTKMGVIIYDDIDFNEKYSINLQELYFDFVHISGHKLAMLSNNFISIIEFEDHKPNIIKKSPKIETNNKRDALIATDKYLIVGGKSFIYHIDLSLILKGEHTINGDISNIQKIHDQLFLAATNKGEILQIMMTKRGKDDILDINNKLFISHEIYYVLFKNINTILFIDKNGIQILTIPKKEGCTII